MTQVDGELLAQAGAGDTDALRLLLKRYGPQTRDAVRRQIGKHFRAVLDVDDVMQVTYLEAFLHIEQLVAHDPAAFGAWLTRIAENVLRDAMKELGRKKRPPPACRVHSPAACDSCITLLETLSGTSTAPGRKAGRHEAAEILNGLIRKLPRDYRTVVEWADLEGRSLAEVAEAMGRSVGAVHMLRARAHLRLRELLGSESRYFTI